MSQSVRQTHGRAPTHTQVWGPGPAVPEALGLLRQGPGVPPVGRLVELGQQGLAGLLAGVVGELDGDGLGGAGRLLPVQALDGLLGLYPLIKADEAHAPGATCGASTSQRHTPLLLHGAWGGRSERGGEQSETTS